ncbi:hypothetical protein PENDEC_c014G02491 [Penicillium decumbens]|uniref:Uncharacterized protein n=1 Tax=Penicillium decumbens TaxID=69771 RepID=A0A1V6P9G1_PENDC|nr:hypothetical protein PENDEC_c014G02491 [Penicillium decumbens]
MSASGRDQSRPPSNHSESGVPSISREDLQAAMLEVLQQNPGLGRGNQPPPPPVPQGPPAPISREELQAMMLEVIQQNPSLKAANIGFFDPGKKFKDETEIINNIACYSDVFIFIDRMRDLVLLKSELVELTVDEKRLINEVGLESGWFAMLIQRFKPSQTDALMELDQHTYT